MPTDIESKISRWIDASVIDYSTAERIRSFEAQEPPQQSRWMVFVAVTFGALMLGAGVLLFVAAHWDQLSPAGRFSLVLLMVAVFHVAGGLLIERSRALGVALHFIGTCALGAGIYLGGQIFNLQEHWPGALLLWSLGALLAWWILGDAAQAILAAILVPLWIACDMGVRGDRIRGTEAAVAEFVAMIAVLYLSAPVKDRKCYVARAMNLLGAVAFLPAVVGVTFTADTMGHYAWENLSEPRAGIRVLVALITFALPLVAAWIMRGRDGVWNLLFAVWLIICGQLGFSYSDKIFEMATYGWWALGAVALTWWGVREASRTRINVGIIAFGATIIAFYFSAVMDKLGRSASLIAFGALFLLGGWYLEKFRRKLVQHARGGAR